MEFNVTPFVPVPNNVVEDVVPVEIAFNVPLLLMVTALFVPINANIGTPVSLLSKFRVDPDEISMGKTLLFKLL